MGLYYQAFTGGAAGRGITAEDILRLRSISPMRRRSATMLLSFMQPMTSGA